MKFAALIPLIAGLFLTTPAFAQDAAPACVDVEKASAKDLEALKGVGPALSKRIIDHRKAERTKATKEGRKTWNFQNWATLMKVEGVAAQICKDNVAKVCFSGKVQKTCPAPK
jgi:DNA uptake protein ComE-like DNA-binding protein